jgi:ABC-type multidrug transport system fused ATPase/permease subunit
MMVAFALILVGAALEMLSLGMVIPVIQSVVSGDRRADLTWLPEWINQLQYVRFVQLLMFALVILFIVKNLFLLASSYFQQRFQLALTNRVVQQLFETYLRQRYEFHLQFSSSVLVRNAQEYSAAVVSYGVAPILIILTDVVTGLGLLGVLMFVQPMSTTLLLTLFGLSGYLILRPMRTRTRRWGEERMKHRGVIMEMLLAGLGGIKEIQLFGRESQVVDTHRTSLFQASRVSYLYKLLQDVPRATFEIVAVLGIAILIVVSTVSGQSLEDATLVVALFGVVAFRMFPTVNRIIQAIQQLTFGNVALNGAIDDLSMPQPVAGQRRESVSDRFQMLAVRELRYMYPSTQKLVADIDQLRIHKGESVGIVGGSGSGKSTLVDLLIGILTPSSGGITVNGKNIADDPRYWQDRIGYVPQHVYLMDTTVRRNVAFGLPAKSINDSDVEKALRLANLWDFVQTLPKGLDTEVGERGVRLSGGQRQRLGIARALYGNPEVIVLDEATSALDSETEREIVESFREIASDHTLIVVAHRTSTLAYCSRLIRLENGRIVQDGTYEEVIGSLSAS